MFFRAQADCFNTEHIARIRRIQERETGREPVRYRIDLVGLAETATVAGDDLPAFEAWLRKECPAFFPKPEVKPDDAKKVA